MKSCPECGTQLVNDLLNDMVPIIYCGSCGQELSQIKRRNRERRKNTKHPAIPGTQGRV